MKNKKKQKSEWIIILVVAVVLAALVGGMFYWEGRRMDEWVEEWEAIDEENGSGLGNVIDQDLVGTTWVWDETVFNNDEVMTPNYPGKATLTFSEDGMVAVTTDCNSGSGTYEATADGRLTLGPIAATRMFCFLLEEPSQETEFFQQLGQVNAYVMSDGQLVLNLMLDTGNMYFSPGTEAAREELTLEETGIEVAD